VIWGFIQDSARRLDRGAQAVERAVLLVAILGMTALAFNEYLARGLRPALGTDLGGLWALNGQLNLALVLMVVFGFVGGSLATAKHKHLTVDALAAIASRPAQRLAQRLTASVSAALCLLLARGAWTLTREACHDSVPGLSVWGALAPLLNALTWLLPGDKYGPGAPYATRSAWESAMTAAGRDWDDLGAAFHYVRAGDGFPLSALLLPLVLAFGLMALRFAAQVVTPPGLAEHTPERRGDGVALAAALLALGGGAWLGTPWLLLTVSVLLVLLGAPLFVALGVGTLSAWALLRGGAPHTVVNDMVAATYKQELLAIPFFVFAGNLMTRGGIARRLIAVARALLGPLPGGLALGAVLSCALFAAISGSSPVTLIAIGTVLFPMLQREGYPELHSIGLLTTAGGLGIIVPPSIPMIVYAIVVGALPDPAPGSLAPELAAQLVSNSVVTPRALFLAGVLPGVLIAVALGAYTLARAWPHRGDGSFGQRDPLAGYAHRLLATLRDGALALAMPVLLLGGIYGVFDLRALGLPVAVVFTVTEAAAIAVVYALVIELVVHRELSLRDLPDVAAESAQTMGSLFLILVLALSLNRLFVFEHLPEAAAAWMMQAVHDKLTFLIVANLFLLALGCVMDILSAILIVAPLLAPIAQSYGVHPVHFGVLFIVNLEIGYLTPPMGLNLFVASSVFDRPIGQVFRSVLPFLVVMLLCLFAITALPALSLAFL